jgi:mannose-1-phosphate guanylyltransferase
VDIKYVQDKPGWKGSANAILNAYHEGAITKYDTIVVYYGDIVSNIDLTKLLEQHNETRAKDTVALSTGFNVAVGTAESDGDWIKGFKEKPRLETPVSIGILVLDGSVIDDMARVSSRATTSWAMLSSNLLTTEKKSLPT